jgi:hypothetical protein
MLLARLMIPVLEPGSSNAVPLSGPMYTSVPMFAEVQCEMSKNKRAEGKISPFPA